MCNGMVKVGYSRFLSSHREREVQTFTKPLISCAKRLYITTGKHSGLRTWLIINHTASRFGDFTLFLTTAWLCTYLTILLCFMALCLVLTFGVGVGLGFFRIKSGMKRKGDKMIDNLLSSLCWQVISRDQFAVVGWFSKDTMLGVCLIASHNVFSNPYCCP